MANCSKCGKKLTFLNKGGDGLCMDCAYRRDEEERRAKDAIEREEKQRADIEFNEKVEAILLTTETVPSLNIVERIEIVTAEVAFGQNIFKDLFAGVRDIVGGRSEAVQKTMRDARRAALYELKKEAYEVGANAVVAVDLDYVELSSTGSMVMLVASGTAVRIDE